MGLKFEDKIINWLKKEIYFYWKIGRKRFKKKEKTQKKAKLFN